MVKKKILPWLSVSALIFALPVNAAENNTFMANTPDMYTTEKYIEKREKKYEVMSVTSACVIAAGMYAKYRTRKQIFAKYLTGGKNNGKINFKTVCRRNQSSCGGRHAKRSWLYP